MRIAAALIATAGIAALAAPVQAQTTGLFLTNYESYTGSGGCVGAAAICPNSFPQNTTGKRIRVEKLTCGIVSADEPIVLFSYGVGDNPNTIGNKLAFANHAPSVLVSGEYLTTIETEPLMILGPNRYFTVRPQTGSSVNAFSVICSLAGQALD